MHQCTGIVGTRILSGAREHVHDEGFPQPHGRRAIPEWSREAMPERAAAGADGQKTVALPPPVRACSASYCPRCRGASRTLWTGCASPSKDGRQPHAPTSRRIPSRPGSHTQQRMRRRPLAPPVFWASMPCFRTGSGHLICCFGGTLTTLSLLCLHQIEDLPQPHQSSGISTAGCDRNRTTNLSKASNIVQEKYVLYDVTSFTQKWHSIPVATNSSKDGHFSPPVRDSFCAFSLTAG